LFFTEMWERFSYYGMRGILMLYMTKLWMENGLNIDSQNASLIYGFFTGFVYFTPLFGGLIADRWLGQRLSITIGGITMFAGQLVLFLMNTHFGLGLGLVLLVIGNGFFKPNISTIVGQMYRDGDAKKDAAFSIFYMGINLGALLAPLVIGTLAEDTFAVRGADGEIMSYGFKYGFLVAAIGMGLGQIFFNLLSKKYLLELGTKPIKVDNESQKVNWYSKVIKQYSDFSGRARRKEYFTFLLVNFLLTLLTLTLDFVLAKVTNIVLFGISPITLLYGLFIFIPSLAVTVRRLHDTGKSGWFYLIALIPFVGAIILLIFMLKDSSEETNKYGDNPKLEELKIKNIDNEIVVDSEMKKIERQRLAVIFILTFFVIFFWAGFEQAGSSLTLYTDKYINRHVGGWEIPTTFFQAFNPILIVALAPVFAWLWTTKLFSKMSTPVKMSLGMILLGLGFLFMLMATFEVKTSVVNGEEVVKQKAALIWLLLTYFLHTIGELCLSPVGLSMVTKMAPVRLVSLMMGVWMLSSFFANILGGFVAKYTEVMGAYTIFYSIAVFVIALGLILLLISKRISKLMNGVV
jgi:dipeptide/tripeptide permease